MAFKMKRSGKETPADEGKASEDCVKRGSAGLSDDGEGEDHEEDGKDPDEQAKTAAGQDLIDAVKGGDAKEVYEAHVHLHRVGAAMGDHDPSKEDEEDRKSGVSGKRVDW